MSAGRGNVRRVSGPGDVPPEILGHLRPICLGLPETYEEAAWIGVRWRIRKRTFAHVATLDPDRYARAARAGRPVEVITFRAPLAEIPALAASGFPFYRADWGTDVMGMFLGRDTDWAEVGELLADSYCILAPKKLARQVAEVQRT
jgi:hypothetical protein